MGTNKILFISSGLAPGGKERQLIETVKNLDKSHYLCGIITFNKNHHYTNQAKEYSNYFHELSKRPTRLEPLFSIWKCFRDFKPDIVHTWDTLSSCYAYIPCKFYDVPLIDGSIRDAGVDKGIHYKMKRFFLKRANSVIGNSYAGIRNYKVEGQVIYNSINQSRFLPHSDNGEWNMLMTANFSDYKDQLTFLKASVELVRNKSIDNVYLLGEGPHQKKYMEWISSEYANLSDHFHFPGAVNNVEEYLAKSKIGILCSTPAFSEGLSNSVLEYMAAGLISIVTDLGGSAEIVEDGKNGFLIAPGDYKKIIDRVILVKNDTILQKSIIDQAKNTIETKFSMEKNLEVLSQLYMHCINSA